MIKYSRNYNECIQLVKWIYFSDWKTLEEAVFPICKKQSVQSWNKRVWRYSASNLRDVKLVGPPHIVHSFTGIRFIAMSFFEDQNLQILYICRYEDLFNKGKILFRNLYVYINTFIYFIFMANFIQDIISHAN